VAKAYGVNTGVIDSHVALPEKIMSILEAERPFLCEVKLIQDYIFEPKFPSKRKPDGKLVSKPLEDLCPFLDGEEFKKNMIIPIIDENQ